MKRKRGYAPFKNYDSNCLEPSPLQLGAGTVLLVDECSMSEGALSERGTQSAAALRSVVQKQVLPLQFPYCNVRIEATYSMLLLPNMSWVGF
jgi:hypothetical protein